MTEAENGGISEWRWEHYVIGETGSDKWYQWWTWCEGLDEDESPAGMWVLWGRALREGDVLFLSSYQVQDDERYFKSFEEAFEYRDSLPHWDKTRYVSTGGGTEAYDTQARKWVTYEEMDEDSVAMIEAVWERGPFSFHILSNRTMKPPEYWELYI